MKKLYSCEQSTNSFQPKVNLPASTSIKPAPTVNPPNPESSTTSGIPLQPPGSNDFSSNNSSLHTMICHIRSSTTFLIYHLSQAEAWRHVSYIGVPGTIHVGSSVAQIAGIISVYRDSHLLSF